MATHSFVGLRQSLFSYSLALLAMLDYLQSLVSFTLHAALSKAALALGKIQVSRGRCTDCSGVTRIFGGRARTGASLLPCHVLANQVAAWKVKLAEEKAETAALRRATPRELQILL